MKDEQQQITGTIESFTLPLFSIGDNPVTQLPSATVMETLQPAFVMEGERILFGLLSTQPQDMELTDRAMIVMLYDLVRKQEARIIEMEVRLGFRKKNIKTEAQDPSSDVNQTNKPLPTTEVPVLESTPLSTWNTAVPKAPISSAALPIEVKVSSPPSHFSLPQVFGSEVAGVTVINVPQSSKPAG